MNYLVSILVPIYGVEQFIEKCAISLFEQTYDNIEYIFVNDCTPDRSIEILNSVLERYPDRKNKVKVLRHEYNRGLATARNTAVAAAMGDFIIHVDSDDYIATDTVEKCMVKQSKNDADIVSFGCFREYKHKTVEQLPPLYKDAEDMCLSLIKKKKDGHIVNVGIWGRLIRRSLYTDNHIEAAEGINMAEDYQVITRLSYFAKNIGVIREPLAHYNLQNTSSYVNSITLKNAQQAEKSFQIVFDFFKDKGDDFSTAVYTGLAEQLFRRIVDGIDGHFGSSDYKQTLEKWNDIPKHIKNNISMVRRIVFVNYSFAKLYISIIRFLKI